MSVKKLFISYVDNDSERTVTKFYDEFAPWSDMLQDFCKFLEGAGYIKVLDKVGIKDSPFIDADWQGAVMYDDYTWSDVQDGN